MSAVNIPALRALLADADDPPWAVRREGRAAPSLRFITAAQDQITIAHALVERDAAAVVALVNAAPDLLDELEQLHARVVDLAILLEAAQREIETLRTKLTVRTAFNKRRRPTP